MKYQLTTQNLTTGETINTQIYNHWPYREAWDIELNDFNLKCEIKRI